MQGEHLLAKCLLPLSYSNLAASDTQKRTNLRQTLRKSSQIPPYGFIAAIGLVASAEQAYAVVVDTDNITDGSITPDINETLIDLSNLDVTSFIPDDDNPYAVIVELGAGSNGTATIWNSISNSLASNITVASSFTDITGTSGADSLKGNNLFNEFNGGAGNDSLYGAHGWDTLNGDAGNDELDGGAGDDIIYGGEGDDTIYGGDGSNNLYGNAGIDHIYAGGNGDNIWGGEGNDFLYGFRGDDTLTGEDDADIFAISIDDNAVDHGHDTITYFSTSDGDKIRIIWEGEGVAPSSYNEIGFSQQNATQPDNSINGSFSYNGQIILTVEGITSNSIAGDTYFEIV